MLLESLVKAAVELQGCRVVTVTGDARGVVAELAPDLRYAPRCGQCGDRGGYRDTRRVRHFRHVPLWGIPVALRYAPRRVRCSRCDGVHVEAMPWVSGTQQLTRALLVTLATWARAFALAAGRAAVPLLVGHGGHGRRGGGRLRPGASGSRRRDPHRDR